MRTRLLKHLFAIMMFFVVLSINAQTQSAVPALPPGSVNISILTPLQQFGGDYMSLWDSCCSTSSTLYSVPNHASYLSSNQIWGLDEGVSALSSSGRIYWFFGDTETAFPTYNNGSFANWGIFGNFTGCYANGRGGSAFGLCLGNDTMAFSESTEVAKIPNCEFIPSVEWYANNGYASSSVPTATLYSNCGLTQFINDSGTTGAAPISSHVSPVLPVDDSMLAGLTPNGAFTLQDGSLTGNPESLFLLYTVKNLPGSAEVVGSTVYGTPTYLTRSALLRSSDTSSITTSNPPTFSPNIYDSSSNPIGTFSEVPTGTISVTNSGSTATVTLCSGDPFASQWTDNTKWQFAIWQSSPGTQYDYFGTSVPASFQEPGGTPIPNTGLLTVGSSTSIDLTSVNSYALPPTNSCSGSSGPVYQYAAIPVEGTGPGKFMHVSMEVMATSTMPAYVKDELPWYLNGLSMPSTVVFFFGASEHYRQSHLYLAVMDAADVLNDSGATQYVSNSGISPQGVNKAWYLSSFSPASDPVNHPESDMVGWTQGDETQAIPLFNDWTNQGGSAGLGSRPCIGEQSVRYQPNLLDNSSATEPNRPLFLLTYGSYECGGLYARTSIVPWGQWSGEYQFFANTPQYVNTPYNGDTPTGGSVGDSNPMFTFWYPQMVYESNLDSLMHSDTLLPNYSSTSADEEFNNDTTIPQNALYCDYGGSYWGYPIACPTGSSANTINFPPFEGGGVPQIGNPYGAYQYPATTTQLTEGTDGKYYATVFMNISTFNPYKVWQTSVTFHVQ